MPADSDDAVYCYRCIERFKTCKCSNPTTCLAFFNDLDDDTDDEEVDAVQADNLHVRLSVQQTYFTQKAQSSIYKWVPSSEPEARRSKKIQHHKLKKESTIALTFSKPDPEMHHWETTKRRFPSPLWEKDKL